MAPAKHRVVIIGSGFGGIFGAKALARAPVDVTLIDRTNHHLFQPLLYQVATGILSEGEIAPAIRDVLRKQRNVTTVMGEVTEIDFHARTVTLTEADHTLVTPYDSLIVAGGVRPTYYGHDDFSEFAPPMKTIDDALELRGRIFGAFEWAEIETDEEARRAWLTFVVIGGGPTGVEMAGQIAELSRHSLRGNFRRIDPSSARVIIFEGTDQILPTFGPKLGRRAAGILEDLGVEIRTQSFVTDMDDRCVEVRDQSGTMEQIPTRTKVWAAGMTAVSLSGLLAQGCGAVTDKMGRVEVNADCSLRDHPEVFVVGDMMALDDLPGLAEVAMQSARHAAKTIERRLRGDTTVRPFRYRDLGTLAAVSRFKAVAKFGRIGFAGVAAWILWLVVHLTFLTGFKNRFGALAHWVISFMGTNRGERTITTQQIIARSVIAADESRRHT